MAKEKTEETKGKGLQRPPQRGQLVSPFEEMEQWFDDFFNRGWLTPFRRRWPTWPEFEAPFAARLPKVDVLDRDQEIVVKAELPGVQKDDLDVSLSDNTLTIKATTRHEAEEEQGEYYRREMSRGEFQRTLTLPSDVDSDKVKANFKDGILELTLPKIETAKRKAIKVE